MDVRDDTQRCVDTAHKSSACYSLISLVNAVGLRFKPMRGEYSDSGRVWREKEKERERERDIEN